jgi:hypothetical protein
VESHFTFYRSLYTGVGKESGGKAWVSMHQWPPAVGSTGLSGGDSVGVGWEAELASPGMALNPVGMAPSCVLSFFQWQTSD